MLVLAGSAPGIPLSSLVDLAAAFVSPSQPGGDIREVRVKLTLAFLPLPLSSAFNTQTGREPKRVPAAHTTTLPEAVLRDGRFWSMGQQARSCPRAKCHGNRGWHMAATSHQPNQRLLPRSLGPTRSLEKLFSCSSNRHFCHYMEPKEIQVRDGREVQEQQSLCNIHSPASLVFPCTPDHHPEVNCFLPPKKELKGFLRF